MAGNYRRLEVWQKAMDLVMACFRTTKCFPENEICGLTTQLQRAAVSIPTNIAEGQEQPHAHAFLHHLDIASGALDELERHLSTAQRRHYLHEQQVRGLLKQTAEVSHLLFTLQRYIGKNAEEK